MPLARRSHRKTRTGCLSCKKRRIKCDEEKPKCKNCVQHRIQCQFPDPLGPRSRSLPSSNAPLYLHSSIPSPPISSRSDSISPQPSMNIDPMGCKLIHHYVTSTYRTLSDQEIFQSLWQHQVPELAFTHTFLLRMILAISALHLHYTTPNPQYLSYAHQQYEASLRFSSLALSEISPSNCEALYACCALGFVFELANSYNSKSFLYDSTGALGHWTIHVRGVRTIIELSWCNLASGVLQPIFHRKLFQGGLNNMEVPLERFVGHMRSTGREDDDHSVYLLAVQELVKWSRTVDVGFFGWMCQITDGFMDLLAKKDPYALVIFAHSCVLLKYGEPRYWIGQWARGLVNEVCDYLDPSLRVWLDWPLKELS